MMDKLVSLQIQKELKADIRDFVQPSCSFSLAFSLP